MQLHMLDMGAKIYGDCLLLVEGNRKILVDGAHPGDWRSSAGTPSIPQQLGKILGQAPYKIDLLIVTHCHSDHIGCLPRLVADGTVECEWALVADENLGFPSGGEADAALDEVAQTVLAAIAEEPHTELDGAAFDEFLADAASLSDNYRTMLKTLEDNGTKVVRYTGPSSAEKIAQEFSDFHLRVLGPESDQLKRCSEALAKLKRGARDAINGLRHADASASAEQLYRRIVAGGKASDSTLPDDLTSYLDRAGPGAALNDQSIVIKVGSADEAMLLTGDMQLAKPEIAGLDRLMDDLIAKIKAAGPYKFVKLPHHASYNGFDQELLQVFEDTPAFGISTGRGDPHHPDESVLELLEGASSGHNWARTDRNGKVDVSFDDKEVLITVAKGALNDASPNTSDVMLAAETESASSVVEQTSAGRPRIGVTTGPAATASVEVFARIPHVKTRVTITVDVEPASVVAREIPESSGESPVSSGEKKDRSVPIAEQRLGGGRELPRLLFVTNSGKLNENIGKAEAGEALRAIKAAGQPIVDSADKAQILQAIQSACKSDKAPRGVVVLGGYDVVPAERIDTLPPSVRAQLGGAAENDPDDFIVWSDQIYGDVDGDGLADIAVSRIPDGRSAKLVQQALFGSAPVAGVQRFGLRNYARPFADRIYANRVVGSEAMLTSRQTRSQMLTREALNAKLVYLMLHGSDTDCSRFWGETWAGMLEAMYVGNIPDQCGAVVFSGCCWGALTVRTRALLYRDGDPIQPLPPEQSIALSFVEHGALAFVGCTAAHYSPVGGNLNYFGAPLHDSFWTHFGSGMPAAEALFAAKIDYIKGMPHGQTTAEAVAVENKILRQFTCLGLGW